MNMEHSSKSSMIKTSCCRWRGKLILIYVVFVEFRTVEALLFSLQVLITPDNFLKAAKDRQQNCDSQKFSELPDDKKRKDSFRKIGYKQDKKLLTVCMIMHCKNIQRVGCARSLVKFLSKFFEILGKLQKN